MKLDKNLYSTNARQIHKGCCCTFDGKVYMKVESNKLDHEQSQDIFVDMANGDIIIVDCLKNVVQIITTLTVGE